MSSANTPQSTAAKLAPKVIGGVVAVVVLLFLGSYLLRGDKKPPPVVPDASVAGLVELGKAANSIRFKSSDVNRLLNVTVAEVATAGSPEPLRLPGTLTPDPDRIVRVNARFAGEAVQIETVKERDQERQLRYGDQVKKGQLLAVIWSKDIGEKKSELVDAYSKLEVNRALLKRLESLAQGVVAETKIYEARRDVEANLITVSKIERTLRSWRLSEDEISAVRAEAKQLHDQVSASDRRSEKSWAETEVRAAMSGTLLEKNFNVGDMVEHTDDLFKIADLNRLRVIAHIYEEDLWSVRQMAPDQRKWKLNLESNPAGKAVEGEFELIGSVVDPSARTGILMGWVDNAEGQLAVGQFITAIIQLPANPHEVAIPDKALIEEGDRSLVFVQDAADPLTYTRRRVSISRRSAGQVFLNTRLSAKDHAAHLETVAVGEKVAISGVLGLGGELEKLQSLQPQSAP